MACVNPSGEITDSARRILVAMTRPASLDQVAEQTGFPLYRIRSAARELTQAGLAAEAQEGWQITASGHKALEKALSTV
jgi:predicted transcriptional regulator